MVPCREQHHASVWKGAYSFSINFAIQQFRGSKEKQDTEIARILVAVNVALNGSSKPSYVEPLQAFMFVSYTLLISAEIEACMCSVNETALSLKLSSMLDHYIL